MQIAIADLLSSDDLNVVRAAFEAARFVDGKRTAGFAARLVKENRQAASDDRSLDEVRALIASRLMNNDLFKIAVRPKQLSPLLFSVYEPGMTYGSHVDDALMQGMRTDVSFTLFVDAPEDYEGGELVIDSTSGSESFKLSAGACFVYPSTSLHHVAPVRSGARRVVVGWVRSFVRDAAQRELLFDLDTARRQIFSREGKNTEFDLLSKSVANLLRMWADD